MVVPLYFTWIGDSFAPLKRCQRECDQRYVIGEVYALDEVQERSSKSHAQYFAAINEAWMNLPERIAEEFPTSEKLRKHALIRCGFHDKQSIVASSKAEALRIAAFIKPIDDYAIVVVEGCVVTRYTAQSQSYRAMGKQQFQASKQAVLDWIAALIGTSSTALSQAGEAAA